MLQVQWATKNSGVPAILSMSLKFLNILSFRIRGVILPKARDTGWINPFGEVINR